MPFVDAGGVQVNFPFDPYPCQINYMDRVVKCLKRGENGILESPTGTGKTLCLLCSSLAWLEDKKAQISSQRWRLCQGETGNEVLDEAKDMLAIQLDQAAGTWAGEIAPPKIIYASRTHSQLTQAIQELKRSAYRHFRVCVLGSREQLCIHPQVMKEENTTTKVHICRAKVSNRSCHFYNNVEAAKPSFVNQVMDIEDLVSLGKKLNCCPYYTSRELVAEADIIFLPYNYLLDPKSRRAHGVELQGNIVIFDEAHNLEKICEDSSSFDLSSADLASAIRELQEIADKVVEWVQQEEQQAENMADPQAIIGQEFTLKEVYELKAMLHSLEKQIDDVDLPKAEQGVTKPGKFIFDLLGKVNLTFENKNHTIDLLEKIISQLSNETSGGIHSRGTGLSKVADVIKVVFSREPDEFASITFHHESISKHYKVHIRENTQHSQRRKKADSWGSAANSNKTGRTLSYWCFSPGHAMEDLKSRGVRCIILTSGTLSPLSSFKSEMGIKFPIELENPHVIEKHQVWIGTIGKGPDGTVLKSSYDTRFKEEYQSSLGNAVVNFARVVPHGLLLFFPSYPVMDQCLGHWQRNSIWSRIEQYKPIFVEPKNKYEFLTAMENFYEKINDPALHGAIFAAVCRGKVSEGLDFSDINGRAVVITGLPFPPRMDPKVMLKMQFLDELRSNGGKGLSGQEWYRQQASRAVNQAVGRVIRHKQDYGAIMLCDQRFSGRDAQSQLPAWLRPQVTVYASFGSAIRDAMMFFKTAEKEMPNTRPQKKRTKPAEPGCQGAYFMPTLSRTAIAGMERASTVVSHVPSLQIRMEDVSLAKLKVQYEGGSSGATSSARPQGLLDALSNTEKDFETADNADSQIPSYQISMKTTQPHDVPNRKKKKVPTATLR